MKENTTSPLSRTLNVWALVLIVWSFYRAYIKLPSEMLWVDEFIAKPLIFVGPVYYYVTHFEKKPFFEAIDLTGQKLRREIMIGIVVGIPIFAASLFSFYFRHNGLTGVLSASQPAGVVAWYFMIAVVTAFSQEVLSRGFVLKRLYREWNNIYSATIVASILFFLLHIPALFANNAFEGNTLLLLLGTTLSLSFINSFVYLSERSLVPCILIHAFYSTSIFVFFG